VGRHQALHERRVAQCDAQERPADYDPRSAMNTALDAQEHDDITA